MARATTSEARPAGCASFARLPAGGYHLLSWALIGFLWTISTWFAARGSAWSTSVTVCYGAVLCLFGCLFVLINERRVLKMRPGAAIVRSRIPFAREVAVALFATAIVLSFWNLRQYVEPLLWVGSGVICLALGWKCGLPTYASLGAVMLMLGGLVAYLQSRQRGAPPDITGVLLTDAAILFLVVPTAVAINRRSLWFTYVEPGSAGGTASPPPKGFVQ